ncbi:HK97-gp10 family putative phage morphogenesis protein [Paraburkholderia sp. BR14263]|uniref:HK97-gp10 family putative phage morphogenesis protein n=1 Tax=unclassified Paraburkholderia TaxID=2615204 RepID=UPI0034CE7E20
MPLQMSLNVQGLREADQFLREVTDEIARKMLYAALNNAATPIQNQAKLNATLLFKTPAEGGHSTGLLASSIIRSRNRRTGYAARVDVKVRRRRKAGRGNEIVKGVRKPYGDDPFYARFLEFGTSRMAARPFLFPAAHVKTPEATKRFQQTLVRRFKAYCKKKGVPYIPPVGV